MSIIHVPFIQVSPPTTCLQEVALRMRVGLLQKGGFLHSGFDAVTAADSTINHDFTYAKYVSSCIGVGRHS